MIKPRKTLSFVLDELETLRLFLQYYNLNNSKSLSTLYDRITTAYWDLKDKQKKYDKLEKNWR